MVPRFGFRPNAFSLTELLVVLGVVAVLAALLNPLIWLGIEKARAAACISNLRQIYGGLHEYAADHNEQMPLMLTQRSAVNDPGPTLDTALSAYLTDTSVFHCPADNVLFARSGSSYLWVYGLSVNAQGKQNGSMLTPSFPLLPSMELSQIPFVSDKESFHKTAPKSHIVYADGHVQ